MITTENAKLDATLPAEGSVASGDMIHIAAISDIAAALGRPLAEVTVLYRDLLTTLTASARVTTFLPVLVSRKIYARYRDMAK